MRNLIATYVAHETPQPSCNQNSWKMVVLGDCVGHVVVQPKLVTFSIVCAETTGSTEQRLFANFRLVVFKHGRSIRSSNSVSPENAPRQLET